MLTPTAQSAGDEFPTDLSGEQVEPRSDAQRTCDRRLPRLRVFYLIWKSPAVHRHVMATLYPK
jgi:hypothetical protein